MVLLHSSISSIARALIALLSEKYFLHAMSSGLVSFQIWQILYINDSGVLDPIFILDWLLESLVDLAFSLFSISSDIALGCASLVSSFLFLNTNFIFSALNVSSAIAILVYSNDIYICWQISLKVHQMALCIV